MMTDEELQQESQEIANSLARLPDTNESLTKEEQRSKRLLLSRKYALEKIKEAKAKDRRDLEIRSTVDYSILTDWGEKHPFLTYLFRLSLRNNVLD
jgi:hypothetical protein